MGLVVLLANVLWLLLMISMVKVHQLHLTFLVLVMIKLVLLSYWIYIKLKALTVLLLLRGDLPSGQVGLGELPYAQDLVRFIREHSGEHFHIKVAAYPEMHPQAENLDSDIQRFIEKVKAGANAGITQFFFNPDSYFYFYRAFRASWN